MKTKGNILQICIKYLEKIFNTNDTNEMHKIREEFITSTMFYAENIAKRFYEKYKVLIDKTVLDYDDILSYAYEGLIKGIDFLLARNYIDFVTSSSSLNLSIVKFVKLNFVNEYRHIKKSTTKYIQDIFTDNPENLFYEDNILDDYYYIDEDSDISVDGGIEDKEKELVYNEFNETMEWIWSNNMAYAQGKRKDIFTEYFYTDGATLLYVGNLYNLSGERIRQIIAKVLRMLRHPYRAKYLYSYFEEICDAYSSYHHTHPDPNKGRKFYCYCNYYRYKIYGEENPLKLYRIRPPYEEGDIITVNTKKINSGVRFRYSAIVSSSGYCN